MKRIVVLSGAGISAESGVPTFRDANGLWEGHDILEVASPEGWHANPELVLDFYNKRRRSLREVVPNAAHHALVEAEIDFHIDIVTQNVDDLHERAGSSSVLHLHGELLKVRSSGNEQYVLPWHDDLNLGQYCPDGYQLRPHVVWFGEAVPMLEEAILRVAEADALLIVGTSMQVYPAAGLLHYSRRDVPIFYIDQNPALVNSDRVVVLAQTATTGVPGVLKALRELFLENA